jgi:2-polyprenyl-3-methyl-5-hydroxy-6-metoxy-1,4-benzoquinol methylase
VPVVKFVSSDSGNEQVSWEDNSYKRRTYESYLAFKGEDNVARQLKSRRSHLSHAIRHFLPQDRHCRILDLGAGYGAFVQLAREAGYSLTEGYERSGQSVQAAHGLRINGVEEGDLLTVLRERPDNWCDVVVTFDVIEHLSKKELFECADGIQRILRKGGRWLIHAPNAESPMFGSIRYGDVTHELAFTRHSLAQILSVTKFANVECYEDAPHPHGVNSAFRWALWKLIKGAFFTMSAIETGYLDRGSIFTRNLFAVATK